MATININDLSKGDTFINPETGDTWEYKTGISYSDTARFDRLDADGELVGYAKVDVDDLADYLEAGALEVESCTDFAVREILEGVGIDPDADEDGVFYHATPAENCEPIESNGLQMCNERVGMYARDGGISMVTKPECVYVTATLREAAAYREFLPSEHEIDQDTEMAIYRIELEDAEEVVEEDPERELSDDELTQSGWIVTRDINPEEINRVV